MVKNITKLSKNVCPHIWMHIEKYMHTHTHSTNCSLTKAINPTKQEKNKQNYIIKFHCKYIFKQTVLNMLLYMSHFL